MVSIMVGRPLSQPICGGSIITPWHILTAAQCAEGHDGMRVYVTVGTDTIHTFNLVLFNNTYYEIRKMFTSSYDPTTVKNDIAIFETDRQIQFNGNVGPACLPKGRMNFDGQMLRVLGWGKTENDGSLSTNLLFLDLNVVPMDKCRSLWGVEGDELPTEAGNICTLAQNKGICQGDSGGPLIWYDPAINRYILVGVVSFTSEVCGGDIPTVNTDVGAYLDFINHVVSGSSLGTQVCTQI